MSSLYSISLALTVTVASQACGQTVTLRSDRSICSNVVALTGDVKINCANLTQAQKKAIEEIPAILKTALTNEQYLQAIKTKLDEVANKQGVNASNGIATKGDSNVTGNVVTGNQNILGNNNQLNIGKYQSRKLATDNLAEIEKYLAETPTKAVVQYVQGDGEPAEYAQQIVDMLRAAKWDVEGPSGVMIFTASGGPEYGVTIRYVGEKVQTPGEMVNVTDATPWGRFMLAMQHIRGDGDIVLADPEPKWTPGEVMILVNSSPLSKPQ
jgi:hypothetical protein